jgi:hypothetical protein
MSLKVCNWELPFMQKMAIFHFGPITLWSKKCKLVILVQIITCVLLTILFNSDSFGPKSYRTKLRHYPINKNNFEVRTCKVASVVEEFIFLHFFSWLNDCLSLDSLLYDLIIFVEIVCCHCFLCNFKKKHQTTKNNLYTSISLLRWDSWEVKWKESVKFSNSLLSLLLLLSLLFNLKKSEKKREFWSNIKEFYW